MWGIVPAAGIGSRIQPRAYSTELVPISYQWGADSIGAATGLEQ